MVQQNFLLDIFEEDPLGQRALFESLIPQNLFGQQRQQLSNLFQPTFNRFLGEIGQQVRSGGPVTQTFRQSLEQFDPQRALFRQPRTTPADSLVTPTIFRF